MEINTVIVGEQEAGRSSKVHKMLVSLLENVSKSTLDIAELLSEVKNKKYYAQWGYNTFKEYVSQLDIKVRKAQYLVRIIDVMNEVGLVREEYEPLGLSKLREITSLEPKEKYIDPQGHEHVVNDLIIDLVERGKDLGLEEIKETVRQIKGLTGENELVWLNFCVNKEAKEKTIYPALELMKQNIGSVGYDEDGDAKDSSDGKALEFICAEYLNDPANMGSIE